MPGVINRATDATVTEDAIGTKALKKKDALIKPDFDSLPVGAETKLKKQIKALGLSFHSPGCAAL